MFETTEPTHSLLPGRNPAMTNPTVTIAQATGPTTVTQTSLELIMRGVSEGECVVLVTAQGISTRHTVVLDYNKELLYYFVTPDGGPYEALRQYATGIRAVDTWPLTEQNHYDAMLWAVNEAEKEVALESDRTVEYRGESDPRPYRFANGHDGFDG